MSLTRLLYVATLAPALSPAAEAALRTAMAKLAVTGTLVALTREGLGVLEGTRPAVLEAYNLLVLHDSHEAPEIIEVEDIEEPDFPDWTIIRPRV